MRAEQYIRISAPKLEKMTIRGIASGENVTLAEFNTIASEMRAITRFVFMLFRTRL